MILIVIPVCVYVCVCVWDQCFIPQELFDGNESVQLWISSFLFRHFLTLKWAIASTYVH